MPIKFTPHYTITPEIAQFLIKIEEMKQKILHLPLTPTVLNSLRESARLFTTHYSTLIEGNRLEASEIEQVLKHEGHFPGRERDEREVKSYYNALRQVEEWATQPIAVTEKIIQTLHALVMANGKIRVKPTPYRDGQNVIRDGHSKAIVYLPPEAKDVPKLMKALVQWINLKELPCPLSAAIAHYQFATIHPYYDSNGRTARLLTTLILHLGGYDLKGLYSLEEYYARNLGKYYEAIGAGPSYNYYMGRAEADITPWVEYFTQGMAASFANVLKRMTAAEKQGAEDQSGLLRELDPKQRRALELFYQNKTITASQVGQLFTFKPRTASLLCKKWVDEGFLEITDPSKRSRKYRLGKKYERLIHSK